MPSRRSLDKHFLTHDKASLAIAVCVACSFPAPNATMLEWHVFAAHPDVARGLLMRRWPRLGRTDHSNCSFCSAPQSAEVLLATCCVCSLPLLEGPWERYYIPGMVLPPLVDPFSVAPPLGFTNMEKYLPRSVEAGLPGR